MCADERARNWKIRAQDILEIQGRYPELAWLETRGMRNIMAHKYFGVSIPIIWQTIQNDLAPLAEGMQKILKEQD